MKLTVVNQTSEKLNTKRINKTLGFILNYLKQKRIRQQKLLSLSKEITFVFLTPLQMQKINLQFRGKDKPTDVLSFSSAESSVLGELLFCTSMLKKQAKDQAHSLELELCYMMIHGILHLLGYDHEVSLKEEKQMFRIQNSCFAHVCHLLS